MSRIFQAFPEISKKAIAEKNNIVQIQANPVKSREMRSYPRKSKTVGANDTFTIPLDQFLTGDEELEELEKELDGIWDEDGM